jgi:threonine dehydrogenase-like Zn-dependent dehydrogenase
LGHELGVEIVTIGGHADGLQVGDRCAVEPYLNCGVCVAAAEEDRTAASVSRYSACTLTAGCVNSSKSRLANCTNQPSCPWINWRWSSRLASALTP